MTNAEKFKQVFGVKPDLDFMPFDCDCIENWSCPFAHEREDGRFQCSGHLWWVQEYKEIQK